MEKFITATGKSIDLAIEAGLTQLGMDRDSVSVEILETPKSGFFGIGASPAKVKLTYEAPDEPAAPAPALSSASRSKPKKPAEQKPSETADAPKVIAPAAAPIQRPAEQRANAKPASERPERPERPKSDKPRQPRADKPKTDKPRQPKPQQPKKEQAPAEPKVYAPAEPGSTEERIEQFIKGLLEHMGSDAVPHAMKNADDSYSVDLVGENLGILIGRRGETLDAIQHLANYAVNRGAAKRARINVDAENYRLKREESLQRLAVNLQQLCQSFLFIRLSCGKQDCLDILFYLCQLGQKPFPPSANPALQQADCFSVRFQQDALIFHQLQHRQKGGNHLRAVAAAFKQR